MSKTVKVQPIHLKVIIHLGVSFIDETNDEGDFPVEPQGMTIEQLTEALGEEEEPVLEALDGLIECGVIKDREAESFWPTRYGYELFQSIYIAAGKAAS